MKKLILIVLSIFILCSCTTLEKKCDLIAIAWRDDIRSDEFASLYDYLSSTGADVIVLEKTTSEDIEYYSDGSLSDLYLNFDFSLSDETALILKETRSIDVSDIVEEVDLVVFSGGADISPSLYKNDYEVTFDSKYNPERDVSDYLLMRYCLDNDIPTLAICRGMQMMGVVSGARLIDDIPAFFGSRGFDGDGIHLSKEGEKTFHYIDISEGNIISESMNEHVEVSSSHHQAIDPEHLGSLSPLAYSNAGGVEIIEAAAVADKPNIIGVQFHPEYYNGIKMKEEGEVLLMNIISQFNN